MLSGLKTWKFVSETLEDYALYGSLQPVAVKRCADLSPIYVCLKQMPGPGLGVYFLVINCLLAYLSWAL